MDRQTKIFKFGEGGSSGNRMIFHGKQTYSHELMSCLNCSLAFNLSRNFTIWSDMPDAIGLIRKNNLQIFISN